MVRHHGEDVWENLLDESGLDGAYTSLGSYPDADVLQLVSIAAHTLNSTSFEVLRWFGREAMPLLAARYPVFFSGHSTTRPFVLSVNSIIHPEVRMIYPGADVPTFGFRDEPDGSLLMTYASARKFCALAQGFVEGAANEFSETLGFEHLQCMHEGDATCICRITFHGPKSV